MSETVFLDLDGTLTDPKLGITRCIQFALAALDEPVPDTESLTWCIGPPLLGSFEKLVGVDRAARAVELYRERFADVGLFENNPYPDIHQTLEALIAQNKRLYVASSKPKVFVDRILARYDLVDYLHASFGSELDGRLTDKTDLLAYALQRSGVDRSQATMVGDRKHDAIGAQNNKLSFVGVLYGYGDRDELHGAGAQVLIHHHAELLQVLA